MKAGSSQPEPLELVLRRADLKRAHARERKPQIVPACEDLEHWPETPVLPGSGG